MVRKVAIYTHVSTLDQTIDNQLIELRDHCSKMGWGVVKEYADGGSIPRPRWVNLCSSSLEFYLLGNVR